MNGNLGMRKADASSRRRRETRLLFTPWRLDVIGQRGATRTFEKSRETRFIYVSYAATVVVSIVVQ